MKSTLSVSRGIQLYRDSDIAEEVRRFTHLLKSSAGAGPAVSTTKRIQLQTGKYVI
nr:MAG TPA: hypothetical protein [Caudoviricetes sp.]